LTDEHTLSFALTNFGSFEPCPLAAFWPTGGLHATFLFLVSFEARGALSTSRSDLGVVFFHLITGMSHGTNFFYTLHMRSSSLNWFNSPLFNLFNKLPIIPKIIHEYLTQAYL
jgi:hypothetical protein